LYGCNGDAGSRRWQIHPDEGNDDPSHRHRRRRRIRADDSRQEPRQRLGTNVLQPRLEKTRRGGALASRVRPSTHHAEVWEIIWRIELHLPSTPQGRDRLACEIRSPQSFRHEFPRSFHASPPTRLVNKKESIGRKGATT